MTRDGDGGSLEAWLDWRELWLRVWPLLERVKDWREYLREPLEAAEEEWWRQHERTGRPVGQPAFLDRIENLLGRTVRPAQRGPKPKEQNYVWCPRNCQKTRKIR